jgi:NAD(P)H-hydrate epimerase
VVKYWQDEKLEAHMKLVLAEDIARIDNYASDTLGIPKVTLMKRSGEAICEVVKSVMANVYSKVVFLCGSGNNGGDGYAAASILGGTCDITVIDVFCAGQRSEEGNAFLQKCKEMGIRVEKFDDTSTNLISCADVLVDCIFGTGVRAPYPEVAIRIASLISSCGAVKIAADVPLGINPSTGAVMDFAPRFDITVELSFGKCGIYSYPAREFAGKITVSDIGIPEDVLDSVGGCKYELADAEFAHKVLPPREENSNKATFGKAVIVAGSAKYRGAAYLALEAALRSGAGYVTMLAEADMTDAMLEKFPEAIYIKRPPFSAFSEQDEEDSLELLKMADACLLGPGCDRSEGLFSLIASLLSEEGAAAVLDADAINVISERSRQDVIANAKRKVVITPHPGELARLMSLSVSQIQANRLEICKRAAEELSCTVVLKGAATVICGEGKTYINSSGSSALAKAGSGDCLAGLICGVIAQGKTDPTESAALACYIHGKAADTLAEDLSSYGVIPSDLPRQMAREINKLL